SMVGPFRARRDTRAQRRAAKCRARRVSARLDRIDQRGDPRPLSDWTWASWCGKSHTHTGLAHGGGAWVGQPERRCRGPCGGGVVPSATRMIQQLERKGMLARRRSEIDERSTVVTLTEEGDRVLA